MLFIKERLRAVLLCAAAREPKKEGATQGESQCLSYGQKARPCPLAPEA